MGFTFEILVSQVNDQQMVLSAEEPLPVILWKIPFLWQAIFFCISLSSYFSWLCAKPHDEQGKVSRNIYGHKTPILRNILDSCFWVPQPAQSRYLHKTPSKHPKLNGQLVTWEKKSYRNLSFQKDTDLILIGIVLILGMDFSFPSIFARDIIHQ